MSRHILIFSGFITSLSDDIHVILRNNPYPPGSSKFCLFMNTIVIERMSLVMKFLGFHHVLINATLGISLIFRDRLEVVCLSRQFLSRI